MEGYRIIKTMEASKAPVHVIVKSFAASMAATILTVADDSYAYPNAIILHHQPWSVSWGNLTQQQEQMDIFKEWARRLHTKVAEKMGVSLDEFYKQMYEKNSEGDWQEFADKAKELKWVEHVVDTIREEGVIKMPVDEAPQPQWYFASAKDEVAPNAKAFVRLPQPEPFDFYFLYNPTGHYRW
jgi:ATP-dependent Clp protease protease subunit